ncbi:MAG: NAD(P)-dependent oxidoreductase [Candidatus Nanopelagicales bacterium]
MAHEKSARLREILDRAYAPGDYPALIAQTAQWSSTRPLAGNRLLDVTPVFTNTIAKYLPLIAAGADLTVSLSPLLPHDPRVVRLLRELGIPVTDQPGHYDVVMDCAGVQAASTARAGYVELTKSGQHVYESCAKPVFLVDDSRIKLIETSLGTGDGLIRALAHFGHPDLVDRSIVIFGCGKVGSGAAAQAMAAGARVTVIDSDPIIDPPTGAAFIQARDQGRVSAAVAGAWCVVSATGAAGALSPLVDELRSSGAILANLGAEDEFGPGMPASRVLHGKLPVNFVLPEPTHLRYLDATMALVNACAVELLTGGYSPGLHGPPQRLEQRILEVAMMSKD